MRAFRKKYRARPLRAASKQLTAMSRAHGRKVGTIAIVDWTGLPTLTEFQMFQRAFTESGVKTLICAPEDLTYRAGRLRAKGTPIDVVYRRVLLSEPRRQAAVARA